MSKKRKKKTAGMSDAAVQAMYEFGKEKYELATRVTRGVDSVGSLAFAQHCSSYAKDGFKKGYEYGKKEELLKKFDIQTEIKRFYDEAVSYFKDRGFYMGQDSVDVSCSLGHTCIKVNYTAVPDVDMLKKLYVMRTFGHWHDKCCNQCKYRFVKHGDKYAQCAYSRCSDREALNFTSGHGCQGVREYLETGIFPERGCKLNP